jgi:hypothetical protein
MMRGFIRYQDVFSQRWDNFYCFVYNPALFRTGTGVLQCPKYEEERPASDEPPENMSPLTLPEVPKQNLG